MKNTCPKCDTAYNVSAAAVGRKFTCKNCSTPVIVTDEGLDYQNPPAAAPAPLAAAPAGGNAFDFDAGADDEERKPVKAAKKTGKAAKARDDEEEPAPKKAKAKKAADPEPEPEDEEFDALPARKAKKGGSDKNVVKDFLFFKEFIAPLFVKLIFFLSVAGILLGGLGAVGFALISGKVELILGGLCSAVIFVPLSIFMVRVYCELVLLGFSVYDRLGEIKTLLEKGQATTPSEPPSPPTP